MNYQPEQFEKEIPSSSDPSEASHVAEKRIQQAADLPQYQQSSDGSYQRHFSDRQGRDTTLRVEGNDSHSLARISSDSRLHSEHGIRLRASDTEAAQSPPAFHGKGEMGRANLRLRSIEMSLATSLTKGCA